MTWTVQKKFLSPADIGMDGVAINVEKESEVIDATDHNQAMVGIDFTRSTGTAVLMRIEQSNDKSAWRDHHTLDASAPPLLDSDITSWNYTTSASKGWAWPVPLSYRYFKIFLIATAGGAGDLVDADVLLGVV